MPPFIAKRRVSSDGNSYCKPSARSLAMTVLAVAICSATILSSIPLYRDAKATTWPRSSDSFNLAQSHALRVNISIGDEESLLPALRSMAESDSGHSIAHKTSAANRGVFLSAATHEAELSLPLPDGPGLAAVAASLAADSWTVRASTMSNPYLICTIQHALSSTPCSPKCLLSLLILCAGGSPTLTS